MKLISPKITEAIEFAMLAHKDQLRKDARPYIIHPLSVGFILDSAGYSEEVVIAGILHDVVEDTSFGEKDIKEKFGERVAELVRGVTEDKTITSWKERMDIYNAHLKTASPEVQAISAADLLDNRRSVLTDLKEGFDIWSHFNAGKEAFMKNTTDRFEIVKSLDNEITRALGEAIEEIQNFKSDIL